jgi:hypothetical protein
VKSKIQTLATVSSDNFKVSMGDGYTTLSVAPGHTQSIMVKTDQLDEFVALLNHAKEVWAKAKSVEQAANT